MYFWGPEPKNKIRPLGAQQFNSQRTTSLTWPICILVANFFLSGNSLTFPLPKTLAQIQTRVGGQHHVPQAVV